MAPHDIAALFRLSLDPVELVVRGTAVYWLLFLLFRFVLRRDAGSIGIADILLLVVIADASQNAMAGSYETISDGIILVATIAAWNWLIDWAGFRFEAVRRFVEPKPVLLVRNGQVQHRAMRQQMVTTQELMGRLRENGIERLADVKVAYIESDGDISVVRLEAGQDGGDAKGTSRTAIG